MICGMGPLAEAWKRNQIRVPVRSYPCNVFGTSTQRRNQAASPEALNPGLTVCQLESSRFRLSPCGTSPAWNFHFPASRWSRSPRRSITACESEGSDFTICRTSCAQTAEETNMAANATPRPIPIFTCKLLALDSAQYSPQQGREKLPGRDGWIITLKGPQVETFPSFRLRVQRLISLHSVRSALCPVPCY